MESTTINSLNFMEASTDSIENTLSPLIETTSSSSTSATSVSTSIAAYISSAALSMLNLEPMLDDAHIQAQMQVPHNQHNQITFEVPSQHDLLHIENLHQHQQFQQQQQLHHQQLNSLNNLLERFGNAAYEAGFDPSTNKETIGMSNEQISKSVVLNLSDLKAQTDGNWLERLFADADMHTIINYLWIGVVCALIVLSLVFIMFSVYFYRKFRLWKQCNKDIRAQLSAGNNNNNSNNNNSCHSESTLLAPCLSRNESAYYQMLTSSVAPPPCYTIATGLPSYDEALHRQHYAFGMRFLYPAMNVLCAQTPLVSAHTVVPHWQKEQQKLLPDATALPTYGEALKLGHGNIEKQPQTQVSEEHQTVNGDAVIDLA